MLSEYEARAEHRDVFFSSMRKHNVNRCLLLTGSFRGGTSLVASLLTKNGAPGTDLEKFAPYFKFTKDSAIGEFKQYLDDTIATSENGFFSSKIMWPHRNNLSRSLGLARDHAPDFSALFPNSAWINVIRNDKFAQAVSFWKAKLTNRWHVYKIEDEPNLDYDFEGIRSAFIELSAHELLWRDFYSLSGAKCYTVLYEDFCEDIDFHLNKIVDFIGFHSDFSGNLITQPNLKIQRNDQSNEYRKRFIEDFYKTTY